MKEVEHKIDCAINAQEVCDEFAAMGCTCGADKMTWEDELKKSLPVLMSSAKDEIVIADMIDFINSLLKKQRENCAKTMVDWENHSIEKCENCSVIWNEIINAPEPTGVKK